MQVNKLGVETRVPTMIGNQQVSQVSKKNAFSSLALTAPSADSIHFGRKNTVINDADLREMAGHRPAGLVQQIARGAIHFDKMQEALGATALSSADKKSLDGFGGLIRIALRDKKHTTAEQEVAAQKQLDNPSPAMTQWLERLDLTADELREPVVDIDGIAKEFYTPSDVLLRMDKLGLFALKAPEELTLKDGSKFPVGGVHLTNTEYHYVVSEHLARMNMGSLLVPVSANNSIGNNPLALYGSEEQKKKYFPKLAQSEYLAAFGLTEPDAGTDTKRVDTRATLSKDGKKWIINGSKLFITNTQRSGLLFLLAKTSKADEEDQYTSFIVDLPFKLTDSLEDFKAKRAELMNPEGSDYHSGGKIHISDPLEMGVIPGSNQAYIALENFEIPVENVLGGSGKLTELPLAQLQEENPGQKIEDILKATYFEDFSKEHVSAENIDKAIVEMFQEKLDPEKKLTTEGLKSQIPLKILDGFITSHKSAKGVEQAFADAYLGQVGSGRKIPFDALALGRNGFGSAGYGAAMERVNQAAHRAIEREGFDDFLPRVKNTEGKSVPITTRSGRIGDLPAVQELLTESLVTAVGIGAVTDLTSALIDYHAPNNSWGNSELDLGAEAIAAKVMGADGAWDVGVNTQQIFGGQGLFKEHPGGFVRTFSDLWVNRIVEGVHDALDQWVTLKSLAPYLAMDKKMQAASGLGKAKALVENAFAFKKMKFSDSSDMGGGLPDKDVRWLRNRTRELNARVVYTGAKLKMKMQNAQLMNIRIAQVSRSIFAISAAAFKLENSGETLPKSHRLALAAFIDRSKEEVDTALKGISPSAFEKDLRDTEIARVLIEEVETNEPDGDPKTDSFWLKEIAEGKRTLFNEPIEK